MKKKKDGPLRRNRTSAFVIFFVAVVLDVCGYRAGVVYGFAGLYWIAWLFDRMNWVIVSITEAFAKDLAQQQKDRE